MQPSSIFKQTLILTTWLVGVSALWVALLSLVGVTLAGKASSTMSATPSAVTTAPTAASNEEASDDNASSAHGSAHHTTARAARPNR
jgi:hypothetical protein